MIEVISRRRRRSGSGGGQVVFRYVPGDALAGGSTFTGPANRTYLDNVAALQTVGANTLRDGHYIGAERWTLLEGARTNSFLAASAPATHVSGSLALGTYTLWLVGTGSIAVLGATAVITGAGTATAGSPVTFVVTTAGTVTFTVVGAPTRAQCDTGPVPSSFINTTVAAVSLATDLLTFVLSMSAGRPYSIYLRYTDLGGAVIAAGVGTPNSFLVQLPNINIYYPGIAQVWAGLGGGYSVWSSGVTMTTNDIGEVVLQIGAPASLSVGKNGGAMSTPTNSPLTGTLPAQASLTLGYGNGAGGRAAFSKLVVATGILTAADMRVM